MFKTKMKKMKFLSGISAVFALAAVALATTFTSCEKEEFNVKFEPVNATATVKANVIWIEDGVSRVLGDNEANVTYSPNSTFTGNPTLAAQTVTVTATYKDISASMVVNVPALQAGQNAYITPTLVLVKQTPNSKTVINNVQGATTVAAAATAVEDNYTNYYYEKVAKWTEKSGMKIVSTDIMTTDLTEQAVIYGFIGTLEETYTETPRETEVYVGAQSRTEVTVTYSIVKTTYEIWKEEVADTDTRAIGDKTLLASIVTDDYQTSVFSAKVDQQIPGHNHAPMGHGHGHGHGHGEDNAGGGIIVAD